LVAIVVAALTGGGFVAAYEYGMFDAKSKSKSTPAAKSVQAGRRVKVRVSTAPQEGVTVYEKRADGSQDRLGMAPLTLDWRFVDGTPRMLMFSRSGFHSATVDVTPPAELKAGASFPLDVKLVPAK